MQKPVRVQRTFLFLCCNPVLLYQKHKRCSDFSSLLPPVDGAGMGRKIIETLHSSERLGLKKCSAFLTLKQRTCYRSRQQYPTNTALQNPASQNSPSLQIKDVHQTLQTGKFIRENNTKFLFSTVMLIPICVLHMLFMLFKYM